jgi:hypothetical protein
VVLGLEELEPAPLNLSGLHGLLLSAGTLLGSL